MWKRRPAGRPARPGQGPARGALRPDGHRPAGGERVRRARRRPGRPPHGRGRDRGAPSAPPRSCCASCRPTASEELQPQPRGGRHAAPGRRLLPQLHPPRRPRRADLLLRRRHRPRYEGRSATRARIPNGPCLDALAGSAAARRGRRPAAPRAAGASCARARSAVSGTISEKYSSGGRAGGSCGPTARMRPFTATARSRTAPGEPPSSWPATRVGRICSRRIHVAEQVGVGQLAAHARASAASAGTRRPSSSRLGPIR